MSLPIHKEIEIPLLSIINELGGGAKPRDIYPRVTAHFPQITEADLRKTGAGKTNKWTNRIQWVRQNLVLKEELERYPRGVWKITEKGRERLGKGGLEVKGPPSPGPMPTQSSRHDELKQKMVEIGNKLGYRTNTEHKIHIYKHDVVWMPGEKKYTQDPCHIVEICAGGSLKKDFDALTFASTNFKAWGILVVVDDADYKTALQRFENQEGIVVVKAEVIDKLCELVDTDIDLLKAIFK